MKPYIYFDFIDFNATHHNTRLTCPKCKYTNIYSYNPNRKYVNMALSEHGSVEILAYICHRNLGCNEVLYVVNPLTDYSL